MKLYRIFPYLFAACLTTATVASCDKDDDPNIHFGGGGIAPQPENPGDGDNGESEFIPTSEITARMETPEVKNDGTTIVVSHSTRSNGKDIVTYSLEFDTNKYHSRWVAFRFDGTTRGKNTDRTDAWNDDPKLPSSCHIGTNTFRGYDRGHLCASADRLYSRKANEQTFYMSNMSPQNGDFNQKYWVTLEGMVQRMGRNSSFADTLYVVKGGTINDDQIRTWVNRPNGKRVAVPKYYYMALLKVKNGVYSSIAYWMEHRSYGRKPASEDEMRKNAVSVNKLEELTGINFFPNLPNQIEEAVENQLIPSNWK